MRCSDGSQSPGRHRADTGSLADQKPLTAASGAQGRAVPSTAQLPAGMEAPPAQRPRPGRSASAGSAAASEPQHPQLPERSGCLRIPEPCPGFPRSISALTAAGSGPGTRAGQHRVRLRFSPRSSLRSRPITQ